MVSVLWLIAQHHTVKKLVTDLSLDFSLYDLDVNVKGFLIMITNSGSMRDVTETSKCPRSNSNWVLKGSAVCAICTSVKIDLFF